MDAIGFGGIRTINTNAKNITTKRSVGVYIMTCLITLIMTGIIPFGSVTAEATRPISWEVVENDGSYANPVYAYDNVYNDTTTKADIDSPAGTDSHNEIYESLAYTFNLGINITNGTLYYTWSTSIGIGYCWDGNVQIFYWNWNKSKWDEKGIWGELSLATRALPITSEYINSTGSFKVKFLSKSGCSLDGSESSKIELYDLYVYSGEMLRIGEPSIKVVQAASNDLHMLLAVGMVCIIGLTLIHVKKQEKYIKLALSEKLAGITCTISFITVFAVFTFLNSGFGENWEDAIVPSTLLVAALMALLIGVVMGMFIFSIKKCGVRGRKERGVGMGGVVVSMIAAFAGCCGSIVIAFFSVGAAVFLTQYGVVFKILAVTLLFFSIILMARNIKKEEVCMVCGPTADVKTPTTETSKVKEESDDECCKTGIEKK
ncbi:MAG: hypothetical protein KJ886_05345 [Candidatus Thermoplasmatota archaeon]|nr:hypothetical protein [Candidatus Thermoplasmatota archaeon]MBU4256708.1 hypothetical protein [Candidatus Thermoplasmatota archaeon]